MKILTLWRSHRLPFIVFLVALSLTALFLVRTVVFTLHWADPTHQEQTIEGWMPIRYVARSWDVPPDVLAAALGMTAGERPGLTVADIADQREMSVEEIAAILQAVIADYRSGVDG